MLSMQVGQISTTYDHPFPGGRHLNFPYGFSHDLSLITSRRGVPLPAIASPLNLPVLSGWAAYSVVLDGGPVYACRFNATTNGWRSLQEESVRQALVLGTEYTWDKRALSHNISILWRTKQEDHNPATSFYGSVLCSGRISDFVAQAVVFQNFEIPLGADDFPEDQQQQVYQPTMRGGFLLPEEIRRSKIDMSERESHTATRLSNIEE